mmetsp:Transcript_28392/g.82125  ORF Transcript_28392/g.82125 Transcript_28392/m.82125 type:complete len:639 (+) Transcript_28392:184-2100(+)
MRGQRGTTSRGLPSQPPSPHRRVPSYGDDGQYQQQPLPPAGWSPHVLQSSSYQNPHPHYPVQTLMGGTAQHPQPVTPSPPQSRKPSRSMGVYDAPPPVQQQAAPRRMSPVPMHGRGSSGSSRSHRRNRSSFSQSGEETVPLIGSSAAAAAAAAAAASMGIPPPIALTRSNSGGRGSLTGGEPPLGILREPRRSRGFSSDAPLLPSPRGGSLPPISPAAPKSSPPPNSSPTDEMVAAHERLQNRSIRSSGIGLTSKQSRHRRSQSATDGQISSSSILLKDGGGGYGATGTASSSPSSGRFPELRKRLSFQNLTSAASAAIGGPAVTAAGQRPPSNRRSSYELRRPPSPSPGGYGAVFDNGTNSSRPGSPLPPRPRARTASAEGHGVTFMDSDSPPASPHPYSHLPPRPRVRTSSTDNASVQEHPFSRHDFASPLDGGVASRSKPGHRRIDSATSAASFNSALSFVSDMSVTSYVSDIAKSKLFKGITESGDVHIHLPIDNVRLTMDPDLEAGILYKQQDEDEIEQYEDYHLLCTDPTAQDLLGFGLDDDLACNCTCKNCNHCSSKRDVLPDVRYVLNVDDDLFKRVLSEIADSRSYPCGLFYCGRQLEDGDAPSIWIAVGIVIFLFVGMATVAICWPDA